jgi:flagellar biosynthesis protein FlhB
VAVDQDRRTEPASPRQIRQARRKGQVARSRDLGVCANLLAALMVLWVGSEFWVVRLQALASFGLHQGLAHARAESLQYQGLLLFWLDHVLSLGLSVILICSVAAIVVNGTYNGWLFAPAAVAPQFDRLSPAANLRRMMSPGNWVELAKSLIKILLLMAALWLVVRSVLPSLIRLPLMPVSGLPALIHQILSGFLALMLLGMGVVAAFDAWYQRISHLRELRMTREETQRERRDDDGDPAQRARRRQTMREIVQDSPLERCAYATVIICSSSPVMATAMYWDEDAATAPWLLNKGRDVIGLAIIQIGRDGNLLMIEDADLCARIYRQTGIDADLSSPLAAQVRDAYRLARRSTRPRSSSVMYS